MRGSKPMKKKGRKDVVEDSDDDDESDADESDDDEAKPARPTKARPARRGPLAVKAMKRKGKAMKRKAMKKKEYDDEAKPAHAMQKARVLAKGSLTFPSTLATMKKTLPIWYGQSAVYFDVRGSRMRVYAKRGDRVEHSHINFTKDTARKQWAKVKAVLLELNP